MIAKRRLLLPLLVSALLLLGAMPVLAAGPDQRRGHAGRNPNAPVNFVWG